MIQGCINISFSEPDKNRSLRNSLDDIKEISFHSVEFPGFEGGYWLHPKLPYTEEDHYYKDEKNDMVVLASGNIYNREKLHPDNAGTGKAPLPELAARLFIEKGPGFVKELNGDFAIFIARPQKKEAFLLRDHAGIKPLAWTTEGKSFYFSSDIAGLCRTFSERNGTDAEYLLGWFRYIDYRKTPVPRVRKLSPGHWLHLSERGMRLVKYWEPERIRADRSMKREQMLGVLKRIVHDSVTARCDKRFNAGTHLSSGIDTGIISAIAAREYRHQGHFYGFSWSPGEYNAGNVKYDERELVLRSAAVSSAEPVFSDLNARKLAGLLEDPSVSPWYHSEVVTANQAAERGINLLFSGWGGDEFISTGDSGIEIDLLRGLHFRTYFRRNPVREPGKFLKYLLIYVIWPFLEILDPATARSFRNDAGYIKKPYKKSDGKAIRTFYSHRSRRQMHLNMLRFYHLQERAESWALLGFRRGVEYRYPLLDCRIIEYMLKVPSILLCMPGYYRPLLREIGKELLDEEVRLNNDKTDPVYWKWMKGLFREVSELLAGEVPAWKDNPDLHFVDFDLLLRDIGKFRSGGKVDNEEVLFKTIVYLKWMDGFTRKFRSEGEKKLC